MMSAHAKGEYSGSLATPVSTPYSAADAQLDPLARIASSSLPGTLLPENGDQTPQQEDDVGSGDTSAPDTTASSLVCSPCV